MTLNRDQLFQSLGTEVVAYSQRVANNTQVLFQKALEMGLYSDYSVMKEENLPFIATAVKYFDIGYAQEENKLAYSGNVVCPQHTEEGAVLLMQDVTSFKDFQQLSFEEKTIRTIAKEVACYHHERWDGQGYPDGLKKEEIPLVARMCAICFEYECLTNNKVKDVFLTSQQAVEQIALDGGRFDPNLVKLFVTMADLLETCHKKPQIQIVEKELPQAKNLNFVTSESQRAIEVKYQKAIDLVENECDFWQAEVVINDNFYGTFYPEQYFSIAERSGQIVKIFDVALEQIAQTLYVCNKERVPKIATRVSGASLLSPNFVAKVEKHVKSFKIEAGRLQFDVATADVATADSKIVGILEKLRAIGVQIALCEFGWQYQTQRNLDYLKFDFLKIDNYLTEEMQTNPQIKSVVEDVFELADKYGVETICSGIDSQEKKEILQQMGCLKMYGEFIGEQISQADLLENNH